MLASDVAQLVRTQLIHHLGEARAALPAVRGGIDDLAGGVMRGNVDATLATSRLGRAIREASIAEAMLQSVGGRYGQPATRGGVQGALDGAAAFMRRSDEATPSLERLISRARATVDDPAEFAAARSAIDERLDGIAQRLDDVDEQVAARTPQKPDRPHGWIGEDGEFHDF